MHNKLDSALLAQQGVIFPNLAVLNKKTNLSFQIYHHHVCHQLLPSLKASQLWSGVCAIAQ